MSYTPRLRNKYFEEVVPAMQAKFNYSNSMQVPRIEKIVLNQGIGAAVNDKKMVDSAIEEMTKITGQRAIPTISKKAISNFKLRENMPIGCKVTLRSERMYDFMDRLISVAMPRIRDFQGINPKSFDGHGNFNLGLDEQLMFPELSYDTIDQIRGMDIAIVTTSQSDQEGRALLKELGMPFREKAIN